MQKIAPIHRLLLPNERSSSRRRGFSPDRRQVSALEARFSTAFWSLVPFGLYHLCFMWEFPQYRVAENEGLIHFRCRVSGLLAPWRAGCSGGIHWHEGLDRLPTRGVHVGWVFVRRKTLRPDTGPARRTTRRSSSRLLLGRKHSFESPISSDGDMPDNGRHVEASHRVDEILPQQMGLQSSMRHYAAHRRMRPIE